MTNRFSFTKPQLENLKPNADGKPATYHDTHRNAYGLQIRISANSKTFFIQRRIDGIPERVTIGKFPDLSIENARNEAARLVGEIAKGNNPKNDARSLQGEMTLQMLFDDFLKHRRNKRGAFLADKTKRTYQYDFDRHLGKWGKRKLSQFKDTDFGKLHSDIGKNHPTEANRVIALASSLFSYAKEKKLFTGDNPAHGIKKFPENKRERFIQADELPAFFEALAEEPNESLRDVFMVALLTGMRRSNVLSMQWANINFDRAEWFIPKTKNGESQTVTLSDEAIEILKNRIGCHCVWVFPGTGKTGHLVEPKRAWQRVLGRAGIDNLRIHDLRRTLGSWQAKTGASLVVIGKSLNHKSPSTTAIYARLDLDPVRQSINTATNAILTAAGVKETAEIVSIKKAK